LIQILVGILTLANILIVGQGNQVLIGSTVLAAVRRQGPGTEPTGNMAPGAGSFVGEVEALDALADEVGHSVDQSRTVLASVGSAFSRAVVEAWSGAGQTGVVARVTGSGRRVHEESVLALTFASGDLSVGFTC
jgi:hypothetical protein